MKFSGVSWRDRIQLLNAVLFCLVGALMIVRYFAGEAPGLLAGLGVLFLAFGAYRLGLARKELRKRGNGPS